MQSALTVSIAVAALALPASAQQFTVVGIPDTQNYSESFPQIYYNQTQWIASNIAALNVAYVNHYGDLVQNADVVAQWQVADQAQATIDATGIPTSVTPGNHDITQSGSSGQAYIPQNYQSFFPPSRYSHQPWWGGASPSGMSSYQVWAGGGRTFLSLSIEVDGPPIELEWAQGVLDQNRDKPVIFTTHRYLQDAEDYTAGVPIVPSGRYPSIWYEVEDVYQPNGIQSEQLWRWFIRRHPQIFMVNCGHFHEEFHQTSTNLYGDPVHEILADYQDDPNGGNGWLRYYEIDVDAGEIEAVSYSPWLDQFRSAPESSFVLGTNFDDYVAEGEVAAFQHGINGYFGTQDTWLNQAEPNTAYGTSDVRISDDDVENFIFGDAEGHALVRFDGILGPDAVPAGATVTRAYLTLDLADDIDNPLFDPDFYLYRVVTPWDESSTWNSMGNGLQPGSDLGALLATFKGDNVPDGDGMRRFDVTSTVQDWIDGQPNWGFAILPEIISGNDDGIEIRTSESGIAILRPRLEVEYEEPCGFESYGIAASPANTMTLAGSGLPTVGGVLIAVTTDVPSGAVSSIISLAPSNLPLLGGAVLIDPSQTVLSGTNVASGGISSWIVPIPNDPVLGGLEIYLQSFSADGSLPEGLAMSNGLLARLCD